MRVLGRFPDGGTCHGIFPLGRCFTRVNRNSRKFLGTRKIFPAHLYPNVTVSVQIETHRLHQKLVWHKRFDASSLKPAHYYICVGQSLTRKHGDKFFQLVLLGSLGWRIGLEPISATAGTMDGIIVIFTTAIGALLHGFLKPLF